MSERWGECRSCYGHGEKPTPEYIVAFLKLREINPIADPPQPVQTQECGRCGGTGFSGDIQDYPG